jgi:hypothetical protein
MKPRGTLARGLRRRVGSPHRRATHVIQGGSQMSEPDPRVVRLVQQLDQERQLRIKAERKVQLLIANIARMKQLNAADAKKAEQRPR